ncbi:CHASE3 domain protein, partial [Mycobacterium kansasii]
MPAGHGLLLITDGLFEGYSGSGRERLGEDGLLALARSHAALPGPHSSTRSSTGRSSAPSHSADSPTTSPCYAWSAHPDDCRRDGMAPNRTHRAGMASAGADGQGVMVLAGAVAGAILLNRTDELSRQLRDDIAPSRVAACQLQSALRDQETGIRGYLISADTQFLG